MKFKLFKKLILNFLNFFSDKLRIFYGYQNCILDLFCSNKTAYNATKKCVRSFVKIAVGPGFKRRVE